MKKLFLFMICVVMFLNHDAQSKKRENAGLDSLKQSFKAVGNLFKKSTKVNIRIRDTKATDQNLVSFVRELQHVPGVMNIRSGFEQNDAILSVSYKGSGGDLWQKIPQGSKSFFIPAAISDTAIDLTYKYAKPSPAATSSNNVAAVNVNATNPDVSAQHSQAGSLSKGAALLFKNVKSSLSNADKNALFKMMAFRLSKDGQQFTLDDNDAADYPFGALVYPTDINKDGVEEIFLVFGNSYTSGAAGSSIVLYIADKSGKYNANLGFGGTLPDVLPTSNLGYPDLLIGGPGFEWPAWRWNGKEYVFHKEEKVDEKSYAKLKTKSLEEMSKAYMASLK